MATDVLIIYPPEDYPAHSFHKEFQLNIGGVPLGALYIASHLRSNGIQAEVYDARVDFDLSTLKDHQPDQPVRLGASDETIIQTIKSHQPKIVGVSNLFLTRVDEAYHVCDLVKSIDPKILTVMGGASCSILKTDIFNACQTVDVVVLGEGEEIFLELCRNHLEGNPFSHLDSIAWRESGQIQFNNLVPAAVQDLDTLADPDYSLVDMDRYFRLMDMNLLTRLSWCGNQMRRAVSVVTTRGCPYSCIFCTRRQHNSRRWRAESVDRLVNRIRTLKEKYDITHFYIEDDASNVNPGRFETFLDRLIQADLGVTWSTPNGIRGEGLTEAMVKKCVQAGCISLQVGVESGDQQILRNVVKKKLDLREVEEGIRNCHHQNLDVGAFFIIGFPGETKSNIFRSIRFMLKLSRKYACRIHLAVAIPMPGTELYDIVVKNGYLKSVSPGWSIRNLLTGTPKTDEKQWVIETPDFSHGFLNRWAAIASMTAFAMIAIRSCLFIFTNRCGMKMAWRLLFNQAGGWGKRVKVFLFRFLIFPKMIKKCGAADLER